MRVVVFDLDTLRPDHLGCYGYHRDTSPNIDRIASQGTRFTEYYAPDAPCLPSRAALVSGMHGIKNGAINHGGTCADMRHQGAARGFRSEMAGNCLWSIFRRAGMHTCTISPFAERHSSFWFLAGMNEVYNTGQGGMESAENVTPVVMDWLERNGGRDNWMLHINYWDPHTPYRAPEEFGNPFVDEPLPEWLTAETVEAHAKLAGPHTARDNGMYTGADSPQFPRQPNDVRDREQLRRCIDGYDCGIRYMDEHIGRILSKLEEQGVLEDTAIIVTSDHGENFGELGIYSEHGTADCTTCRIPMIIKWPGARTAQVDNELHYNFDLLPTLCDLLEVDFDQARASRWDGRSYAETLKKGIATGREELILSQCAHVCQRSVRWDNWLYMRTYHDGLHPHFGEEMLFDVHRDPHETTNLIEQRPEIAHEGAARLLAWHDRMMRSQPEGYHVDPMDIVLAERGPEHASKHSQHGCGLPYREYFNRLRSTGREKWIAKMIERHPWLEQFDFSDN